MLLADVTVSVALYAALATPKFSVSLALTAAVAGVGVVVYWIYPLISVLSKGVKVLAWASVRECPPNEGRRPNQLIARSREAS
jgi:hypothetical protein